MNSGVELWVISENSDPKSPTVLSRLAGSEPEEAAIRIARTFAEHFRCEIVLQRLKQDPAGDWDEQVGMCVEEISVVAVQPSGGVRKV